MKVRKAISKIAALGVGGLMVGATLMGAMAQDLSDYPSMFIEDGEFNGYFVVGEAAMGIDTLGVTNIAVSIQSEATTQTQICAGGGGGDVNIDEGVELGKNDVYLGDAINEEDSELTETDLDFLEDGTYTDNEDDCDDCQDNDNDYTQEIVLGAATVNYYQDDDDATEGGPYVFASKQDVLYTYVFEFDEAVEYEDDSDDFATTTIDIQGRTYTITEADFDGSGVLDELTLQSGETTIWITQGDVIEKQVGGVTHTIEMVNVAESEDKCGIKIDGSLVWIATSDTETVNGVTVGVTDVTAVHSKDYDQDICQINIGADEIVLKDGDNVEIEGAEIEDAEVTINNDRITDVGAGNGTWMGFNITFTPDEDIYLAVNDEYIDPVFKNFKFTFGGLETSASDTIVFDSTGNDATVTFMNIDGKEVEMPFNLDGSDNVILGDGTASDDKIYLEGESCDTGTLSDCEGAQFLLVNGVADEIHIVEITELADDNNEVSFEDITYDLEKNEEDVPTATAHTGGNTTGSEYTFNLGSSIGTFALNLTGPGDNLNSEITLANATGIVFHDLSTAGAYQWKTENAEATMMISWVDATTDAYNISITEYDNGDVAEDTLWLNVTGADEEIDFEDVTWDIASGTIDADDSDEPDTWAWSASGGTALYNTDDDNDDHVEVTVYYEAVFAQVFVAPTGAQFAATQTDDGCTVCDQVNRIPATVTKLDTDVSSATAQNVITVGGPCVNSVTATLMGANSENCAEGFEANKAIIQLVQNGDNFGLVVAGLTGKDTLLATRIMHSYEDYDLEGMKMIATTVSESSLSVSSE
jgi:hypothetical protein